MLVDHRDAIVCILLALVCFSMGSEIRVMNWVGAGFIVLSITVFLMERHCEGPRARRWREISDKSYDKRR